MLKPASPTPWSILKLMELIEDIVPPGVINIVNGPGAEIGKALATNKRIAKIAFTGETVTGRLIMQYAAQNIIPSTTELGGKSPNIFFADVMAEDDDVPRQGDRGPRALRLQQGRGLHVPVAGADRGVDLRAVHGAVPRADRGDQAGPSARPRRRRSAPQVSTAQLEKIESYVKIGLEEGAELLIGGKRAHLDGELEGGYYFEPTVFKGHNEMRIFQEEIFGPVLAVTTFKNEREALEIANDTMYGLGAGVWTRDTSKAFRMGRGIKAGRVWTNCYHLYPGARGLRRLQGLGRRAREPQDDARPLHADEVPARQLRPEAARVLLGGMSAAEQVVATDAALAELARLEAKHGPLMLVQSGGCCDGSSPFCLRDGELLLGPDDLLLGEVGGARSSSTATSTNAGTRPRSSSTSRRAPAVLARRDRRVHFVSRAARATRPAPGLGRRRPASPAGRTPPSSRSTP